LHCQVSVLDLFLPLSKLFQKSSLDVDYARNVINNLFEALKHIRTNCDSEFSTIFENAEKISKSLNITVSIQQQTKRQVNRNNIDNSGPEDFYKKTIYIPMLDNIIMDIMERFSNQLTDLEVNIVIPSNLVNINDEVLKQKIDNISTNFAKVLELDKIALKY
jgi:parvulin-like peptidyl-prolyl isomerase